MKVRRCSFLFLEPRHSVSFDLTSLLHGGNGIRRQMGWVALAPHLERELPISPEECALLARIGPDDWIDTSEFSKIDSASTNSLIRMGLLINEDAFDQFTQRDKKMRSSGWWPLAALTHRFGRWKNQDSVASMEAKGLVHPGDLRKNLGAPPPEVVERVEAKSRLKLHIPSASPLSHVLENRATCRNFSTSRLDFEAFSKVMHQSFAALSQMKICDDTIFLKKNSPSGGGLHATGIYVLVQNVEKIEPGFYHYHPIDHALEPINTDLSLESLRDAAQQMVAGQHWFAGAQVLTILAPRYGRSFWKYKNHAKAYRALILDAGHLSQTLYLSATELGLGAFVTAAINEVNIEETLGLDALDEGPLAICGFGIRSDSMEIAEFDPNGNVWSCDLSLKK
ncbi:putative peptide maturation dehydrogenase [Xanthomonas melonis]|uniref:Putative peptide maturation dehydrogenase n=1 Tax=Xanthomonas melonis TaxID=56456 RepID=A0A2S7D9P2_9XANT|nr:putative peptide maturation dehydrogenase [Xanthomonas melonis]MCC4602217.1 putative peptide maturation dehydrogenase [Xanthomonas melonis]PPU70541.1 putative peptide maturation dehydrogenase [Xanthomonas melonis]